MIIVSTIVGVTKAYARRDPDNNLAWDRDAAKATRFADQAAADAYMFELIPVPSIFGGPGRTAPRNSFPIAYESVP